MTLSSLISRVERATGPDEEIDALVRCAIAAPTGSYVEQSPMNGAWCIYEPGERKRLWESRGWWRAGGWPVTASLDAVLDLIKRVLPERGVISLGIAGSGVATIDSQYPCAPSLGEGYGATPALALLLALLRALQAKERT